MGYNKGIDAIANNSVPSFILDLSLCESQALFFRGLNAYQYSFEVPYCSCCFMRPTNPISNFQDPDTSG